MKNKILRLTALFFFAALFTLTSCRDDADTQSAEDAAKGGYMMADAFAIANDGSGGGKALNARFDGCQINTVEIDNGFEIEFDNCADENGNVHDGTIRFVVDGAEVGSSAWGSITITFIDYTVEGEGIDGTVSALAKVGNFGLYFNVSASNLKLKYKNGDEVTYNSASMTYVLGLANGFKLTISGETEGVNRNGKKFSTKSEDVVLALFSVNDDSCSGTMTVEVEGEDPITIEYSSCGQMEISQKGKKKQTITTF